MNPHPHIDPNLGLGRPYGLPLQAGEVAELQRRVAFWSRFFRWAMELTALAALALVILILCALR